MGTRSKLAIFSWCLYDWANSAFSTIVTTFIFATYFAASIAENQIDGMAQWGFATAIAGLVVAVASPALGAIADHQGRHKPWIFFFALTSIIATMLLWFAYPSPEAIFMTLFLVVIATVGFELSTVFYNAMLPAFGQSHIGRISGVGWGLGYFGGLACLLIALYGFVDGRPRWLDAGLAEHVRATGPLAAAWFFVFSIPLFIFVREAPGTALPIKQALRLGLQDLKSTLIALPKRRSIFLFLIAHMIYMDGLNTLFTFGGIYAAGTFGFSLTEVIQFGIATNIAAGIGAITLSWMDDFLGSKATLLLSLAALLALCAGLVVVDGKALFWGLALLLSLFLGPVQAASRSLMGRLAPKEHITQMYGLFGLSGKITAFVGPWLVGTATLLFESQRIGLAFILFFFLAGGGLLFFLKNERAVDEA